MFPIFNSFTIQYDNDSIFDNQPCLVNNNFQGT